VRAHAPPALPHFPRVQGGDVSIASLVKLLIIDEVHLLNDDRGPVIETLVARTQRQVGIWARRARGWAHLLGTKDSKGCSKSGGMCQEGACQSLRAGVSNWVGLGWERGIRVSWGPPTRVCFGVHGGGCASKMHVLRGPHVCLAARCYVKAAPQSAGRACANTQRGGAVGGGGHAHMHASS